MAGWGRRLCERYPAWSRWPASVGQGGRHDGRVRKGRTCVTRCAVLEFGAVVLDGIDQIIETKLTKGYNMNGHTHFPDATDPSKRNHEL